MLALSPSPAAPISSGPYDFWQMLYVLWGPFHHLLIGLTQAVAFLAKEDNPQVSELTRTALKTQLEALSSECSKFELPQSSKHAERLRKKLIEEKLSDQVLGALLENLLNGIEAECHNRIVMVVPPEKAKWVTHDKHRWRDIAARFPKTNNDIFSAFICFGVDQDTACVFHMMRVLEVGLGELAANVGLTYDRQQWHNIIEQIESEIAKIRRLGTQTPEKAERMRFLSEAAKEFFYFKDGWRNYVSHNRGEYDENQAESIMAHVKGFMTTLAEKLPLATAGPSSGAGGP